MYVQEVVEISESCYKDGEFHSGNSSLTKTMEKQHIYNVLMDTARANNKLKYDVTEFSVTIKEYRGMKNWCQEVEYISIPLLRINNTKKTCAFLDDKLEDKYRSNICEFVMELKNYIRENGVYI